MDYMGDFPGHHGQGEHHTHTQSPLSPLLPTCPGWFLSQLLLRRRKARQCGWPHLLARQHPMPLPACLSLQQHWRSIMGGGGGEHQWVAPGVHQNACLSRPISFRLALSRGIIYYRIPHTPMEETHLVFWKAEWNKKNRFFSRVMVTQSRARANLQLTHSPFLAQA